MTDTTQPQQQAAPQKDPLASILAMNMEDLMPDLSGINDIMNMDFNEITNVPGMDEINRILKGD